MLGPQMLLAFCSAPGMGGGGEAGKLVGAGWGEVIGLGQAAGTVNGIQRGQPAGSWTCLSVARSYKVWGFVQGSQGWRCGSDAG